MRYRSSQSSDRSQAGFSLTEVLLAFGILTMAGLPILSLALNTKRQAHQVSSMFKEAILAQMLLENLKGRLLINPCFLANLETSYGFEPVQETRGDGKKETVHQLMGTVWEEPETVTDSSGRVLGSKFFTQFLINHDNGVLYSVGNRNSLATVDASVANASLLEDLKRNYRGLAYRISMRNGPFAELGVNGNRSFPDEYTRLIRIEIFRADTDRVLPEVPIYSIETVVETPPESLSDSAYIARLQETDDYSYTSEKAKAFFSIAFSANGVPGGIAEMLSDLSLLITEAVGESSRVEGDDLGFRSGSPQKGLDYWIDTLGAMGSPYSLRQRAHLQEEKALLLFRAHRRAFEPARTLAERTEKIRLKGEQFLEEMDRLSVQFRLAGPDDQVTVRARGRAFEARFLAFIPELVFWTRFFGAPGREKYNRALVRPRNWNGAFSDALAAALGTRQTLDGHPDCSPQERVSNLVRYIQLVKVLKLYTDKDDVSQEALIRDRRLSYLGDLVPFSEFLSQTNLFDSESLRRRNRSFLDLKEPLTRIEDPQGRSHYEILISNLESGGRFQQLLDQIERGLRVLDLGTDIPNRISLADAQVQNNTTARVVSAPPVGTSLGLIALRNLVVSSQGADSADDLDRISTQLSTLSRSGGLEPGVQLQLGNLVQKRLLERKQELALRQARQLGVQASGVTPPVIRPLPTPSDDRN